MKKIIENVIDNKKFELKDILKKIDTFWVQGSISDSERTQLMERARSNAKAENTADMLTKIAELENRVRALEEKSSNTDTEEDFTEEVVSYPTYVSGKWYYAGDKVFFDGSNYICVAPDGVVCVWSPSEYPAYWEELTQTL